MVPIRPETLVARLGGLGIASPQQIEQAKQELATTQERFSAILVRQGLLRDADAGKRLATQLGSMPQQVGVLPALTAKAAQIPEAIWRSHRLLPVQEVEGKLLVATDDPLSVFALDYFGSRCGCTMEAVLVREDDFATLLEAFAASRAPGSQVSPPPDPQPPPSGAQRSTAAPPRPSVSPRPDEVRRDAPSRAAGSLPATAAPTAQTAAAASAGKAETAAPAGSVSASDEPIIRLVDSILAEAVRMRASDIHVQAGMHELNVRYRIDGVLRDVTSPPKGLQGPVISRIKIMAGLNIAEKRLPQDGRLQLLVENRPLDVRISTLPASHGESIVMRLLDRSQPIRGLAEMGILPDDQKQWDALIHRPHGIVLVTGPTGSGKTTTLYGALSMLNQPDRKLITVEDPVEYQLTGVNQVLVRASIGLTFAAGLRSMLRQAPDVIMVGEIRDQETAQIAIQAALTGHLVLSTLHTNDAPSAVTRLIDMGIAPFLIASTVQGVLAQRLVRRICEACRITEDATAEERAFFGGSDIAQVVHGTGCEKCRGTGFFGRIGVFELLEITNPIRQLIVGKPTASAIRQAAVKEGMRGLREDGRIKIREGLTTMTEVMRVVLDAS